MIKAIIVDDEQHCISRLEKLLSSHKSTVQIVATCSSLSEAKSKIKKHAPNIVFLDVELQNDTGFQLLSEIGEINFEVIFTTAHNKYAVEAFKFSALDFLLKPIDESDLNRALSRISENFSLKDMAAKIEVLFHNLEAKNGSSRKITIPTLQGLTVVQSSDIIRCQSDTNYTHLHFKNRDKIVASKTLKYFEESLEKAGFFRSHQSHLVNLDCVSQYIKGKGGYAIMCDDSTVEISVRRKEEFLRRLNGD